MPRIAQGRASTVGLFVHIKVVCVGIHLVLKDAVGRSTRCIADDEHAPTADIDPDRTRLIPGSRRDRPVRPMDGASLTFPAHRAASSDVRVPWVSLRPGRRTATAAAGNLATAPGPVHILPTAERPVRRMP
jgi:hypothetical protein